MVNPTTLSSMQVCNNAGDHLKLPLMLLDATRGVFQTDTNHKTEIHTSILVSHNHRDTHTLTGWFELYFYLFITLFNQMLSDNREQH